MGTIGVHLACLGAPSGVRAGRVTAWLLPNAEAGHGPPAGKEHLKNKPKTNKQESVGCFYVENFVAPHFDTTCEAIADPLPAHFASVLYDRDRRRVWIWLAGPLG
jgi:hypothetical protein